MVIYGTFDGFKNYKNSSNKMKWRNVANDAGNILTGIYFTDDDRVFKKIKLKFGLRYMLEFNDIDDFDLIGVTKIIMVNKNPRCDIFRKYKNEFHIINGKYKGKKDSDIENNELMNYCFWLAKNSFNEATIKNSLDILKNIKNKL